MNFDGEVYTELKRNRIKVIVNHFGGDWFVGKKLLELGCGHADMGNIFYMLGSDLTVTDARKEHLEVVKSKYYYLKRVLYDLDNKDWPFEKYYDLILNMGILYHVKEFEQLLKNCLSNCKNMFLESVVSDSDDPNFVTYRQEGIGIDQAFNGIGCRPSGANIERIIKEKGFSFERCFEKDLNSLDNLFDWKPKNSGHFIRFIDGKSVHLRRAWFCLRG